jgi:hypothetical protein
LPQIILSVAKTSSSAGRIQGNSPHGQAPQPIFLNSGRNLHRASRYTDSPQPAIYSGEFENVPVVRPRWTRLSTNGSCQSEKPENPQVKTRGSASTLGVELDPRDTSLPNGEGARSARTNGVWRIQARRATCAAVNKTRRWSWSRSGLAPRDGFEPRFTLGYGLAEVRHDRVEK